MTEKEKCRLGLPYAPNHDAELQREMAEAADICFRYNSLLPSQTAERKQILTSLLGHVGRNACIRSPFYCDYGYNIHIGDNFFANYNFTVLDGAEVTISRSEVTVTLGNMPGVEAEVYVIDIAGNFYGHTVRLLDSPSNVFHISLSGIQREGSMLVITLDGNPPLTEKRLLQI